MRNVLEPERIQVGFAGFCLTPLIIEDASVSENIINRFRKLAQWEKGGKRAPHKPLMLLIALGRYQNGIKEFSFEQTENELTRLLVKYGPQRNKYKPEEPFWRLGRNERIFQLGNQANCRVHKDGGTNRSDLIKNHVTASFDAKIQRCFDSEPQLIVEIAQDLISAHFQPSFAEDLFDEVGLTFENDEQGSGRQRDPEFRRKVLRAYEDKCSICGFHMVFNQQAIGLEAAHIKWHNAGGPDTENNGLALCTLHHKLFDYGVFLIEPQDFKIKLSNAVSCFNAAEEYVRAFHNKKISLPANIDYHPKEEFLIWHQREKFKGAPR